MSDNTYMSSRCPLCGGTVGGATDRCPICGEKLPNRACESLSDDHGQNESSPSDSERFVIVGGGIAAVAAAEEIRRLNATASIVMISEEASLPYYRPALSKELFLPRTGERFSLHSPEWYSRHGIFLLSGRQVARLIPRAKQLDIYVLSDMADRSFPAIRLYVSSIATDSGKYTKPTAMRWAFRTSAMVCVR